MSSEKMESTTTASAEEDGDDVHKRPTSVSNSSSGSISARSGILRRRSSTTRSNDSGDDPPISNAEKSLPSPVDEAHPEKQNRKVCMLRGAMIFTLLSATVVVATLVYLYVTRDEERIFYTQYKDSVSKIAEAFQHGIDMKHDAASTFSAIYTSIYGNIVQEINAQEPVWPNATLPFFAEKAKDLLKISGGRALSFNPIITQNGNRIEWEAHATESAWLLGDKSLVVPPPDLTWPNNRTVSFGIYSRDSDRNVVYDPGFAPGSRYEDVLVPVWQIYPIKTNEKAVMFNLHSEMNRQRALDDMLQYKVPALTAILQLVQDSETRPSSILFFPVFDNFETPENFEDIGMPMVNETNVVGSISIVFSWDTLLQMILPNYIKGMFCVLKSSTGQEYSYSVSGNSVTFLGAGDLHDPKYHKYQEVVEATLGNTEDEIGQVDYLITYTLVMYPSETFENQYVTNRAAIYTAGVVLIFLCTSALFLLYDYLVEDRQQKTISLARQSASIVDSMFPAGFRERLYKSQQSNAKNNTSGSGRSSRRSSDGDEGTVQASNRTSKETRGRSQSPSRRRSSTMGRKIATLQIDKFMKGIRSQPKDHDYLNEDDKPIADLFLDTSIMFADIVGFTKWSTERSPNEVFRLLERLFWEFDELAAQHNVFKLGTIGDCYIAVTGIPNPILDHASVLTKFSLAARDKVREVCTQLEAEGLDTLKLDMRFGIHSGAITAGILRGTKSRFELFGDTINTASRMESTSVGGKIQVSAETAELIRSDGRGRWLVKRDDIVTAKGKGQLQTYWIEKNNESRVSFSDAAYDHLPSNNKLSQLSESDRYYQLEYDKEEETEGLFADEKV